MGKYQFKYLLIKSLVVLFFSITYFRNSYAESIFIKYSEFSSFVLIDSIAETDQFLKKIEVINTLTPVLKWFKENGAIKYFLTIKEYEDSLFNFRPAIIRTYELVDTFFKIPQGTIEENKFYSWNVKSFNGEVWSDFGQEFYFRVILRRSGFTKSVNKPGTHSPGNFYPEIEIIKTLIPEFIWYKSDYAIAYNFKLERKEYDGTFKKIFSSDEFGLIKDTTFVLRGNLLRDGFIYRWNIKTLLPSGYSLNSDFRYFKVILDRLKKKPEGLYPGYKKENQEVIATTTPIFVWKKIEEANSYSIAISKKGDDGRYNLIFDTEGKLLLKDTVFKIPEGVLQNNSQYRWNLKVNLKDGRFLYSPRLYFKVILSEEKYFDFQLRNVETETEQEETLLNMEYAGIIKTFINSIFLNEKIYVSFQEFLNNLQISFNKLKGNVYEVILHNNVFEVNFNNQSFSSSNLSFTFNRDDFIEYNEDYFITIQLLEKILSLKIELDFSDLTIHIQSAKPLPVFTRFLVEQKYMSLQRKDNERVIPVLFNRERYFLNGFVFDYSFSQSLIKSQRTNYFYSAAIGGELLYGDFYISRKEFVFQNNRNKIDDFNWKLTLNPNKYLTQISVGDDFHEGINTYSYRGISLTNEVIEPRKKLGNYLYQDFTEPNSLIELYSNYELLGVAKSDQSGKFIFDIPLRYGMSNLELKIYTPNGETKIIRKVFQIPYELLPTGIFNYRLTYGLMRFVDNKFAHSEFSFGLTDFLTTTTGIEFIRGSDFRHLNFFGRSSLRISSNLFISFFYSPKIYSRVQGVYVLPNFTSYVFEFFNYKKNKFYNLAELKNSFRGNLYLPFKIKEGELGFYFNHELYEANTFKRYYLNLNTFYLYKWFGINAGLINENLLSNTLLKVRDLIFGVNLNFNNLFKNVPVLNRSFLNARSTYNLSDRKLRTISLFSTITLMNNFRLQFNIDRMIQLKTTNLSFNLFLELPQFTYTNSSNGKNVFNQIVSGSIGYSPQINQFYFYGEPLIGRTSIFLQGYEDRNENNSKEINEKTIRGLSFSINSAAYSKKVKEGQLFIGLNPYHYYSVRLIDQGMITPNYSFEFQEFNIITDGNRIKIIKIPFQETGEIGGVVVRKFENEEIPLSNISLVIKNLANEKEFTITTFSDGSFYFFGLKKGKYVIMVNEEYLTNNALKSNPEKIEFDFGSETGEMVIENLKFVLQ